MENHIVCEAENIINNYIKQVEEAEARRKKRIDAPKKSRFGAVLLFIISIITIATMVFIIKMMI